MNIYIGNIPYQLLEQTLIELFAPYGNIIKARIVTDKYSGRSKGFGFIEFSSETEAQSAINALNGYVIEGRAMTVNIAKEDIYQ